MTHVQDRLCKLLDATKQAAQNIEILFVTNLLVGPLEEYSDTGLSNTSQYYNEVQIGQVVEGFGALGFSVRPFYNEIDFISFATTQGSKGAFGRFRIVFTTAEGGYGEGRRALIPSFCNLVGLPCCNSPAHGSSIARHKFHANKILQSIGLQVPRTWLFRYPQEDWLGNDHPPPGLKVIAKPAFESGSLGIDDESVFIVDHSCAEVVAARASRFQQSVVVQEFRTGYEIGVPVICIPEPVAPVLVGFSDGEQKRYGFRPRTFEDEKVRKTASNFTFDLLTDAQSKRLKDQAVMAFQALGMEGLGRIDLRVDEDGSGWIFDTNESPPPLPETSFAQGMKQIGIGYPDMLGVMIGVNLIRFRMLENFQLVPHTSDQNCNSESNIPRPK